MALKLTARIPAEYTGRRLDQALAEMFSDYSRSRLQQWVREGKATLDGAAARPRDKVSGGQLVELVAEPLDDRAAEGHWQPESLPVDVVYEDEHLIVVNKPAGLVVHPAAGNLEGTLVNALLHYAPEVRALPRAGIIHRLDKDTTGLLVVARSLPAHTRLVAQLQAREFLREYEAIVTGTVVAGGTVDAPIGRHPVDRKRMAVTPGGKPAVTHYRVAERFRAHTHLRLQLETGRTHQIRVHMAHIHYPLLGDPVYGGRLRLPPDCLPALATALRAFKRQALHAARLGFLHPVSGAALEWRAPLPADLVQLLELLRADRLGRPEYEG